MYKPRNPLRRQIIDYIFTWTPQRKWTGDPMMDADILVKECQGLLPYIVVAYHRLQNKVPLRTKDYVFENCLGEVIPVLSRKMREWLLSSPYLQKTIPVKFDPINGSVIFDTKIRYGYIDGHRRPAPVTHFEISHLVGQYRYWLDPKTLREPRISDIFNFVRTWGGPENVISLRGKTKEDKYAFIANSRSQEIE